MSIAASLANLRRGGHAAPHKSPQVQLTQLPLKSSLADRAASARNALTLLSTADSILPSFEQRLYLTEISFDRAILPPEAQKSLSAAVSALALRLTPVFLTRPCTAILEWVLQTLQLPTIGSTEEVDGIMLCALPFHETEQFLLIARAVLRSPNARKWRWLVKKAKPAVLVDASFCVTNAPLQVFKLIISRAVECVKQGVAVSPLAALITNFVARRMASDDRPTLAVLCVEALISLRGDSGAGTAKHLTCALLVALAAAVSHGLELPVSQTVTRVAAQFLAEGTGTSDVTQTSVALLALCLRTHSTSLSSKEARMLLKAENLAKALPRLGILQSVETYREIIVRALASGNPSEKHLRLLSKALEAENLLSSESISKLIKTILGSCTIETGAGGDKFAEERAALLASLFTTLFKGTFSSALDDVLHEHFNTRKVEKRDKKRFRIIDTAVSKAMDSIMSSKLGGGTTQEGANESYPLVVDILCLSHPERKKRKRALENISRRELANNKNEKELRRLVGRLKSIIEFERDLNLVVSALESVMQVPIHLISPAVIGAALVRSSSKSEKGTEQRAEREKLANSLLELCDNISDERSLLASAILLLLSFEGMLECCRSTEEGKDRLERLRKTYGITKKEKRPQGGDELPLDVAGEMIDGIAQLVLEETDKFSDLFSTIADTHERWIGELSYLWLKVLFSRFVMSKSRADVGHISERILNLIKLHPRVSDELIRLVEKDSELVLGNANSPHDGVALIWRVTSELTNWEQHEIVLDVLMREVGFDLTLKSLKSVCVDHTTSMDARKRSLEWYVNLCLVHPDVDTGKEAVATVSQIAYGDDLKMRTALDEMWSRRSALNRKKREKKSRLWDFLQLLSNLPKSPSRVDIADSVPRLLSTEIFEAVERSEVLELASRPPLRDASFDTSKRKTFESHLTSRVMQLKQVRREDLHLLRALGYGYVTGSAERKILYSLLESAIDLLKEDHGSVSATEALYRIAVTIILSGKQSTGPLPEVKRLAKPLIGVLNAIANPTSNTLDSTLVTTLLCLAGHVISSTEPTHFPEKDALIELLLATTVSPTVVGSCASRIAGSMAGDSIKQDYLLLLLRNLTPRRGAKSRKSPVGILRAWDDKEALSSVKAALGAVNATNQAIRNATQKQEKVDVSWLRSSLTVLWKFIQALHEEGQDILTSLEGHGLEQLTSILKTIICLHRTVSQHEVQKGRVAAKEADFESLIGVAFAQDKTDILTNPMMQDVRNTAYELVGVLVSCQESGAVRILPKLLQSPTFAGQALMIGKLLEGVLPNVMTQESEVEHIVKVVGDAVYNEMHRLSEADRMKIMRILVANQGETIGACLITRTCLKEIYHREHQISSPSTSAKHCSAFLQHANLTCVEEIDCMILMESELDCRIAAIHFVNPEFLAKLGTFTESNDLQNISLIDEELSKLFVALLRLESSGEKDSAIHLLLAGMPLSAMRVCALAALDSAHLKMRIEALHYLGERFGAESLQLFPTWLSMSDGSEISSKARREIESSFLRTVGSTICDSIELIGVSAEHIEIREVATDTLGALVQRIGSASFSVVQKFGSRICGLSTKESAIIRSLSDTPGKGLILRGKVLESLAIFTSRLAKYSLPFVPHLLESSLVVLEEFCDSKRRSPPDPREKDYNASVFVTAASFKALTAVLTSCPMFFGGKALKRLSSLELRTDVETPGKLLQHAAREVPVDAFVAVFSSVATMANQQLMDASVHGLLGLVQGVSSGVSRLYKSEMKVNWAKLLNVLLQILDCGRHTSMLTGGEVQARLQPDEEKNTPPLSKDIPNDTLTRLKDCDRLDSACADVLIKIVLKLSESEFEAVFTALLQWFDAGSLSDEVTAACEVQGKEVEKNILRGLPFFGMMGKLLAILKTIMVPYFIRLLSRLTVIVGRRINTSDSEDEGSVPKKRKRAQMEGGDVCSILLSQQRALRESCLKLLVSFFSFEGKERVMTARLIGDVQAALLSAFDDHRGESSFVSNALQGLAKRMILPGISNDTKKNQDMLIGLVRNVLSRTRDPNARLRAAALNTCREMASAVGDEFLATLPESMPILAEVIDDEEATVAKAATRYILFLESIAGEPILEQLK